AGRAGFAGRGREGRAALHAEGLSDAEIGVERRLDLRHVGTETALPVAEPRDGDWPGAFAREHFARFGYTREGHTVEIATARVRVFEQGAEPPRPPSAPRAAGAPQPRRSEPVWFPALGRASTPVYWREDLAPGHAIAGPALILEATGTVVLDPGFSLRVDEEGVLRVHDEPGARAPDDARDAADPVRLEVFGNRCMAIAEQMGAVLRNTSVSTNIKERLDYSCAVFDADGGLVANAPHIPVHLGAMSETVRVVRERFPELAPGDCVATNDPSAGGSHLPDVTVVTPVFAGAAAPALFLA